MKKLMIICFLSLIISFSIVIILINTNVIILNKGNIDGINYIDIEKIKIEKPSKIITEKQENLKKWDEMIICEQYDIASISSSAHYYFNCNINPIPDSCVENYLEPIILSKHRHSYPQELSKNGFAYSIKNVPIDSAIAIRFENTDEYYTYINTYCMPTTLKDIIEQYNLEEYLKFNSITYTKEVINKNIELNTSEISNDDIKSIIYSNTDIDVKDSDIALKNQYFTITSDSIIYGSTFIFYMMNDEYYIVNIPVINKKLICYIGTNKANEFSNYIKNNCVTHAKMTYFNLFEF